MKNRAALALLLISGLAIFGTACGGGGPTGESSEVKANITFLLQQLDGANLRTDFQDSYGRYRCQIRVTTDGINKRISLRGFSSNAGDCPEGLLDNSLTFTCQADGSCSDDVPDWGGSQESITYKLTIINSFTLVLRETRKKSGTAKETWTGYSFTL